MVFEPLPFAHALCMQWHGIQNYWRLIKKKEEYGKRRSGVMRSMQETSGRMASEEGLSANGCGVGEKSTAAGKMPVQADGKIDS